MWIHQRTGQNTAVSAPLWAWVIGLMTVIGLIGQAINALWPLLVGAAVVFGLFWCAGANRHKQHADDPLSTCRFCQREVRKLEALERSEIARRDAQARLAAEAANADRLRAKYGKPVSGQRSPVRPVATSSSVDRLAQRFRERD